MQNTWSDNIIGQFDPLIVEKFLEKIDEAADIFKSLMPEQ